MNKHDAQRHLACWRDECNGALLYEAMAEAEKDPRIADVYRRFARVERRHAAAWKERLAAGRVHVGTFKPSWRTRVFIALAKRFGPSVILPVVAGMEKAAAGRYAQHADAAAMRPDENSHARLIGQIMKSSATRGGLGGGQVAKLEGRHRASGGNALRAAVLGANDGLVSNFSLVMGVAGAGAGAGFSPGAILVTGIAGLLAGACSMALGEWLSVQSSRELYQHQIDIERQEIASAPQEEAEELELIYQARGLPAEHARTLASQIMANKDAAVETLVREELGISPGELGGSAHVAAGVSFLLFACGAIIPVIPFMVSTGWRSIVASAICGVVGLFLLGTATSLFTGRSAVKTGLRSVAFGLAAAGITFGIGRWIGVSVSG